MKYIEDHNKNDRRRYQGKQGRELYKMYTWVLLKFRNDNY